MAARKFLEKSASILKISVPEATNDHMHSVKRWVHVASKITRREVIEKLQLDGKYVEVPKLAEKVSIE